ncbi:unnamed protein product [Phytophthora fragariaefolia]|uniref:Unnamed protein product n=1 Tax=Phytophthora fragariaefolia TaxID=1490495 RepID=A0A9W6Y835_9STRA|nr:unnamed protein product [Phytophthora fragariaefolia]
MMQRKSQSPLEFYYHLNKVADKAGIDFDSSSKQRGRHLKVFTKKLLNSRLRTTLPGQRIRKLRDLEYVLKQHEEMTQGDDNDGPPPKRDFRADNVSYGRFQPKRSGRAYAIQDEDSPDEDADDREVWFEDLVEEAPNVPSAVSPAAGSTEAREAKLVEKTGGSHEDSGNSGEILKDRSLVVVLDEDSDSDDEVFYNAISFDGDDGDEDSQEVVETEPSTGTCSDRLLLPVRRLEKEYERCMQMSAEELSLEPAVYIHEGSELIAQLRDELGMLPELQELSPECDISKADVGEPGRTTPAEEEKLRTRLRYHHRIFLGDGNAAPAPARGMWWDLDVGVVKPVAQRPRSIAPHLAIKVYDLLKKLLETRLIEHSGSPWASPIVIVLNKNGVDIRVCIDYRVVNGFIQLSNYPLPLIDDMLIGFESAMWFMSLDMASGFWAIRKTERAKLISAFVCPFGHFQWVRMPFGLKNAPLVYQAVINNCLWGFVRLSLKEEAEVDQDVLEFLGLDPSKKEDSGSQVSALTDTVTVFQRNIPAPATM